MDWCSSWLPTESNPDYRPSQQQLQLQQQTDALTAIVSESGSAADQVTRITDQIANIFDTSPTRRTGMGCPTRRDCDNCCIERQGNETDLQHKSRLLCCLRSPDETDYRKLRPIIKPLPKPILPLPETPDQLPPPGGQQTGNITCTPICYNGYPGIRCINQTTGEIVSETYGTYQSIKRCCRNECINNTWHTVCDPDPGINRGIPCDQRPPKL
jgi:hypothetical protein